MHITTTTNGVSLGKDLQEFIDLRLHFALGRFSDVIDRVSIRIVDTNGPRGGIDKQCRIVVKLRGSHREHITVDDHDTNSYASVARVIARAGRKVARSVERRRRPWSQQQHRSPQNNRFAQIDMGLDIP